MGDTMCWPLTVRMEAQCKLDLQELISTGFGFQEVNFHKLDFVLDSYWDQGRSRYLVFRNCAFEPVFHLRVTKGHENHCIHSDWTHGAAPIKCSESTVAISRIITAPAYRCLGLKSLGLSLALNILALEGVEKATMVVDTDREREMESAYRLGFEKVTTEPIISYDIPGKEFPVFQLACNLRVPNTLKKVRGKINLGKKALKDKVRYLSFAA